MNQDMVIWLGSSFGVLGGAVGTWCSIRNTRGPRERAFMIRVSVLCWLAVTAFLATLFFLPFHYHAFLCLPEMFGLHFAIRAGNRKLEHLRAEESGAEGELHRRDRVRRLAEASANQPVVEPMPRPGAIP